MKIFVYAVLMAYLFFLVLFFRVVVYYLNFRILIEWLIFRVNSLNIEIILLIDWISLLFIGIIFLISSIIMIYRYSYMEGEKFIERFIYLVILFIFSIIIIIISPNIVRIIFGWDGLGLVSYCLVIFYQNYMSYNSGMVTVLCNRIGDVGLLIVICLLIVEGRWNLWIFGDNFLLILIFLFLAAITKRAQIPFSVWLPMAMAAPTPVSALVHSSTLVTAGVYLIIRFNRFLISTGVNVLLFFLSILTIFISGAIANVENDLKKIIALSTLSQLGLIMIVLSVGCNIVAFFHLLTHAIFKSLLFMCAGVVIHLIINNQDIRFFGNMNEIIPFTIISFFISNLALCGFPFLAGFYSKDLVIEIIYFYQVNIFILIFILVSLILTVIYSVRLFYYLFFSDIKFFRYMNIRESNLIRISMFILIIFRVIIGSLIRWLFFFDFYIIVLSVELKGLRLGVCLRGLVVCGLLNFIKALKNFYFLNFYLGSMWFLGYLYFWVYNPFNIMGVVLYEFDKRWVEFSLKNFVINYFIKNLDNNMLSVFLYIFVYLFIRFYIVIYLIY